MILAGRIDDRNRLWVTITVTGNQGQQQIEALIDTGFTGELLLPLSIAVPLGLTLAAVGSYKLADGSTSRQMLFSASVAWGSSKKLATVNVVDTDDALMGGGFLHGYLLVVDFEKKTLIIKEPNTDEPQPPAIKP